MDRCNMEPVTGCQKISPGCTHCYAERVFPRAYGNHSVLDDSLSSPGVSVRRARRFTDVVCHEDRLEQPLHWRKPRKIFVNSMSDLFHEDVPDVFIDDVFLRMALCPQHTFQILTKRPERMLEYCGGDDAAVRLISRSIDIVKNNPEIEVMIGSTEPRGMGGILLPNVWLGVSAENQKYFDERVELLGRTPAAVRFLSIEPMLENIDCGNAFDYPPEDSPYGRIDWVIVGGESGHKAQPFNLQWARSIVTQCRASDVPVFVKQMGSSPVGQYDPCVDAEWELLEPGKEHPLYSIGLKDGHGGDPSEWPIDLRVREFPRLGFKPTEEAL